MTKDTQRKVEMVDGSVGRGLRDYTYEEVYTAAEPDELRSPELARLRIEALDRQLVVSRIEIRELEERVETLVEVNEKLLEELAWKSGPWWKKLV